MIIPRQSSPLWANLEKKYYDGISYGICGHITTGLFLLNKSGVHIISLVKRRWVHQRNIIVLQRTCREFLWLSNKKNRVQIRAKLASSVPSMYRHITTGLFLLYKSGVHIISLVKRRRVHQGHIVLQHTCREFLRLSNKKNRVQIRAKLASSVPSNYRHVQVISCKILPSSRFFANLT